VNDSFATFWASTCGTTTASGRTAGGTSGHHDLSIRSRPDQPNASPVEPSSAACLTSTSQPHKRPAQTRCADFWNPTGAGRGERRRAGDTQRERRRGLAKRSCHAPILRRRSHIAPITTTVDGRRSRESGKTAGQTGCVGCAGGVIQNIPNEWKLADRGAVHAGFVAQPARLPASRAQVRALDCTVLKPQPRR
jgi:hypothetical protein